MSRARGPGRRYAPRGSVHMGGVWTKSNSRIRPICGTTLRPKLRTIPVELDWAAVTCPYCRELERSLWAAVAIARARGEVVTYPRGGGANVGPPKQAEPSHVPIA